jgi:DNA-binding FadR family transcriptional regulator
MNKIGSIKKIPLIDQSTELIKEYIMSGNLKAGDFLPPEMDLCKQLSIGRSTLREAIKTLELQGFVRKKHGVGMMIINESEQAALDMLQLMLKRNGSTMEELMEVRYAIELRTTKLAAINASKTDIEEIERHLQIMKSNISTIEEYVRADINFHQAVAKASHNTVFEFILNTIRPLLEEMIQKTLKFEHRPELSMKYHENIFEAIYERDPEKAVEAIKEHLKATNKMLNLK